MWIKSLDSDIWVSMKHVTHFKIQGKGQIQYTPDLYNAYAYLDRPDTHPARILVCQANKDACREFY